MRVLVSVLLFSTACFAQFPLSFGIKGGVPLTDSFKYSGPGNSVIVTSPSKDYVIGPMAELRLPFHLAIEADALYRPLSVTQNQVKVGQAAPSYSGDFGSWEFPIVAKYRFGWPVVKPYVEAGPSFRATSAQPLSRLATDGVALGVGVDFHLLLVHVEPEFRYTHWASDSAPTAAAAYINSKQNQVEFLVGLTF
ncbi:MAG TPA: outer membrane beta-barrel protein [Bryobacteraceae bacterium]|jgi:hypothetical protein|nr:outer membrane beta-barrel protein [Bryobacteraceae bacterium]